MIQEVANQIVPLKATVDRLDRTVRSLYRNGTDGAPGFLETAREIDNGRFDMIFKALQEFKDALKPVTEFMRDHESREAQHKDDQKSVEKKFNTRLVLLGLGFSAISLLTSNLQGCKNAAHSFFYPDQVNHSKVQSAQQSDAR